MWTQYKTISVATLMWMMFGSCFNFSIKILYQKYTLWEGQIKDIIEILNIPKRILAFYLIDTAVMDNFQYICTATDCICLLLCTTHQKIIMYITGYKWLFRNWIEQIQLIGESITKETWKYSIVYTALVLYKKQKKIQRSTWLLNALHVSFAIFIVTYSAEKLYD